MDLGVDKLFAVLVAAVATYFVGGQIVLVLYLLLCFLIVLDWLTGVWVSRRIKGQAIESGKLGRTGDKFVGHTLGTLALWALNVMFNVVLIKQGAMQAALASGYLAFSVMKETWSVFENMDLMGMKLPQFITKRLRAAEKAVEKL